MDTPKLPKGYIWRITGEGAEIWKKLKAKEVTEVGQLRGRKEDVVQEDYRAVRHVISTFEAVKPIGVDSWVGCSTDLVRYTKRRKRVFRRAVDWSSLHEVQRWGALEEVLVGWRRLSEVPLGFVE